MCYIAMLLALADSAGATFFCFFFLLTLQLSSPFRAYHGLTTDHDDDAMTVTTTTAMPHGATTPYGMMAMTVTPHAVRQL
jgi:hypothetical protein